MSGALSDPWEGDRVARWVKQSPMLEAQLAPIGEALFAAARLSSGESVLDVGCGTGPTTVRAAADVGPDGSVTGLDVSHDMLAAAAQAPVPDGAAPIQWLEADAVEWTPPSPAYDVVLSRFGVMFFSDSVRAFTNLAAATLPDGRLAMTTWARRDESSLFSVPLMAALAALGRDASGLPDDEGPFSLPDPDVIASVLEPAGWVDVECEVHRLSLPYGGGLDPAGAASAALDFGPTRLVVADLDDEARNAAERAITDALADHVDAQGQVVLGGTINVVTAHPGV